MQKLKGRYLALAVSAIGVLTLAAATFVFRDYFREQWYLLKLDSTEPEMRDHAIRKLGEMRSVKALPHLRTILLNPGKDQRADSPCARALVRIGQPAIPVAEEAVASANQKVRMSGIIVLTGMAQEGSDAEKVPVLLRLLDNRDRMIQSLAGSVLRSMLEQSRIQLSPDETQKLDRIWPKGSPPPNPFQWFPGIPGISGNN